VRLDELIKVISVSILTCAAMPVIKHHSSVSTSAQHATATKVINKACIERAIASLQEEPQHQLQTETTPFRHGF
jgi:hypothetical protein